LGDSVEGRPIRAITLGDGPVKVLLWSQMHGNESTATRAILDVLQFFNRQDESDQHQDILKKLTICIIPLLNPDGTHHFQRRNALEIDINRDIRYLTAPESQILQSKIIDFKADFAFNLHDQRRFYNISGTARPSTISFLAPAFNNDGDINQPREQAMQLIACLRESLETVIPGQVGVYDDTFTPRAFGDYVQGTGASTILIESGWEKDDLEKEYVRKLNFCLLITALKAIANNSFNQWSVHDYGAIPMNDEKLFDVLIRNVSVHVNNKSYKYDIGVHRSEVTNKHSCDYYACGEVTDIGDLKEWYGFEEVSGEDLVVRPGMIWPETHKHWQDLNRQQAMKIVRQGYLFIKVSRKSPGLPTTLPLNVVSDGFVPDQVPVFEGKANFLLTSTSGDLKYVVINGFLWNMAEPLPENINGLVL
jgi:Zinc carboxypeptidase